MVDQTKISGFAAASRQWTVNEQNILRNLPTNEATMIPWRAGIAPMPAQATQTAPTSIFTAPTPAPAVTTPAIVTTAVAQNPIQQSTSRVEELYSTVYNKTTGKYDVKKGNKLIKSVYSKSVAEKFVKQRNDVITDALRQSAPLGDVTKQGNPVTTPAVPAKPVATTPVVPKSATQTAKDVSKLGKAHAQPAKEPLTWKKYAAEHGGKYNDPGVSGVVENDKIAERIRRGRAEKRRIEQIFKNKPEISAESINRNLDIGKENVILDGMNDNYRFLEERSNYKRALEKHLHKPTEYSPEILDKLTGHGPNKELDAMNDYYRALEQKGDDVADVVKKFDWKKFGKIAGIGIAVAGAAALAAYLISKAVKNKQEEKAEDVEPTPVVPVPVPENEEENVTPVEPTPAPVEPTPAPVDPFLPLNPDGTYTTKKGDCFWKIAERNLKDKFRNEPEKFENLPEKEKNAKIQLETRRIMKLNGYTMAEDKWHSAPTLYPNVNIKINETIDVAA